MQGYNITTGLSRSISQGITTPFVFGGGGSPSFNTPLRTVAVQNRTARDFDQQATLANQVFRYPYVIGQDSTDLYVLQNNWYTSTTGTVATGNPIQILDMSIESPGGVVVPVYFSGSRGITLADGAMDIKSDRVLASAFGNIVFTRGEQYWIKGRVQVSAPNLKIPYTQVATADVANSQSSWYDPAVTTVSSTDIAGVYTNTGTALTTRVRGYRPMLIGHPVVDMPSFFLLGDSIVNSATGTSTVDTTGGVMGGGFAQRAMRQIDNSLPLPSINMSASGSLSTLFINGTHFQPLMAYINGTTGAAIEEWGTNDINLGASLATMQTRLASIWSTLSAAGITKIIRTHILPKSTSTDSWATTANQTNSTPFSAGNVRDQLNTWIDSKKTDNTLAMIVTMRSVEDITDATKWTVNGVANYATTDGTHPITLFHQYMAQETRNAIAGMAYSSVTYPLGAPAVWIRADDPALVKDGSNLVASLTDESKNGRAFAQGTSNAKPLWVASVLNGKPILRGDGVNDYMDMGGVAMAAVAAGTLFVVANQTKTIPAHGGGLNALVGAAGSNFTLYFETNNSIPTLEMAITGYTNGTSGLTPTNSSTRILTGGFRIYSIRYSQAANEIIAYENGQEMTRTTLSAGTNATLQLRLFMDVNGIANGADIAEMIFYDSELTTNQHTQMIEYLRNSWQLFANNAGLQAEYPAVQRYAYANGISSTAGLPNARPLIVTGPSQSNDGGRGLITGLPASLTGAQANEKIWNDSALAVQTLNVGVNQVTNDPATQHGPEVTLMKAMQTWYGVDTYLFKYYQDETNLAVDWNTTTGANWLEMVARRKRMLDQVGLDTGQRLVPVVGVISNGNTDALDVTNAANYQANLTTVFSAMRTLWGVPTLKIACIQINSTRTFAAVVKAGMVAAVAGDANTVLIPLSTTTIDSEHVDSAGLQIQGMQVADYATGFSLASLTPFTLLDTSIAGSITQSGGAVSAWADQSGNAINATQPTGANQPITGTRTIGNRNAFDYDGTDDFMILANGSMTLPAGANAAYVVYATDASTTTQRLLGGNTGGTIFYTVRIGTTQSQFQNSGTATNTITLDTNPHISGGSRAGTVVNAFYDTTTVAGTGGADVTLGTNINIGRRSSGTAEYYNGVIGMVFLLGYVPTPIQDAMIRNHLKWYWGLSYSYMADTTGFDFDNGQFS